ncbi:HEPN domain-containing protein [Priestia aryabhattai]|uniref:HEPN domain-containing protein n=1 Tax=Priestia aryabhattai TaxID=412384 RepID=UPI003D2AAF6A
MKPENVIQEIIPAEGDTEEYSWYENSLKELEECIQAETYISFEKILYYLKTLKSTHPLERNNDRYSLMSSYSLILLSSTYDIGIKEIFKYSLKTSLSTIGEVSSDYILDIINTKILNRYFTNIKHDVVKKSLLVRAPGEERLQRSIAIINDLITARNNLAHGINPESKTHTDLEEALEAVLIYLNWFKSHLRSEKLLFE